MTPKGPPRDPRGTPWAPQATQKVAQGRPRRLQEAILNTLCEQNASKSVFSYGTENGARNYMKNDIKTLRNLCRNCVRNCIKNRWFLYQKLYQKLMLYWERFTIIRKRWKSIPLERARSELTSAAPAPNPTEPRFWWKKQAEIDQKLTKKFIRNGTQNDKRNVPAIDQECIDKMNSEIIEFSLFLLIFGWFWHEFTNFPWNF